MQQVGSETAFKIKASWQSADRLSFCTYGIGQRFAVGGFGPQLQYFAGADSAGVVLGARVPVVLVTDDSVTVRNVTTRLLDESTEIPS